MHFTYFAFERIRVLQKVPHWIDGKVLNGLNLSVNSIDSAKLSS